MKRKISLIIALCFFINLGKSQSLPILNKSIQGTGENSDWFNAIANDNLGFIYATGYTFNQGKDKDFLLVKMNAAGSVIWNRQINGAGNGFDKAHFIGLDAASNIYICGESDGGSINHNDILVAKYNSSGTLLWTSSYNASAYNQSDVPLAMSVDATGNVFITGSSDRDSTTAGFNDDILTLKYNTSGTLQWAIRFNGAGNATDRGTAIASTNNGGCIITGRTSNGSDDDAVTIKYNATGIAVFTKIFDRGFGTDRAEAIVTDVIGNIYISGRSASNNDDDFLTVKYDSVGTQLFVAFYNNVDNDRASLLTLDALGNIFVVGQSDQIPGGNTNYDYCVVKYSSAGIFKWARFLGNAVNNEEDPHAIVTDAAGSIFITGKSDQNALAVNTFNDFLTAKYDSAGVLQWSSYAAGSSTNSDDIGEGIILVSGNIYVCGSKQNSIAQKDATVIKYDAFGNVMLTFNLNGAGDFTDKIQATITDTLNNVYVTGYSYMPDHKRDVFTAKFDAAGNQLWKKYYDFSQSDDEGKSIALDSVGNVYVCGNSIGNNTSDDYVVLKYNNGGDSIWSVRYDYNTEADVAVSICVTNPGVVFVTGYSDANQSSFVTDYDIATIKINALGTIVSTVRYGSLNVPERGVKILLSGTSLYVTGRGNNGSNEDIVTIKYSSSLVEGWHSTYAGTGNADDQPRDMVVDGTSIYVTGQTFSSTSGDDYITLKYSATGAQQWASIYNGTGNYTDRAYGIALNNSGAYVTGRSAPTTGIDSADYVTLKLNKTTGATIWSDRYNNGLLDRANAIALSTSGNIFVTGESVDAISGSDFATIMYDANGNRKWVTRFDAGINGEDVARNVAVDKSGSIYVSGYATYTSASQADGSLIKYCAPPSISAGSDKTICKGSSTTLNGTGSGTYSWSPATGLSSTSVATPIANPIVSTTYTFTVTNNTGCSASDVVVVTVNNTPVATVTPTGTQTICSGDSLLLTASAGVGNTYQWKKGSANIAGATASTTYVKLAATYKVVVTNASGCSKTSPVTKLVIDPIAKITAGGPTTFCNGDSVKLNAQTGVGYTYQWKKGSVNIGGAAQSTYTAKAAGSYKCVVTSTSGCTAISNAIVVTVNCRMMNTYNNSISITAQPNPFFETMTIQLVSPTEDTYSLWLYDLTGRMVQSEENILSQTEFEIGSDLLPGIYFLKVQQGISFQTLKIVKK